MEEQFGYKKLIIWQNSYNLRILIYNITKRFSSIEVRRVSQMRDAARSVKQNIQEGYFKSTKSFISYLRISLGSLSELQGDVLDCFDDKLISQKEFEDLDELIGKTQFLLNRTIKGLNKKQEFLVK